MHAITLDKVPSKPEHREVVSPVMESIYIVTKLSTYLGRGGAAGPAGPALAGPLFQPT